MLGTAKPAAPPCPADRMPKSQASRQLAPSVRIGLVHATSLAVAPALAAFRELWPEAEAVSLVDESLQLDAANTNYNGPSFT